MALFASPEIGPELKSVSAGVTDGAAANRSANTSSVMLLPFDSLPIFAQSVNLPDATVCKLTLTFSISLNNHFSHFQTPTCHAFRPGTCALMEKVDPNDLIIRCLFQIWLQTKLFITFSNRSFLFGGSGETPPIFLQ